jgi:glucosamine--fructose-6-phosphate aminotransferase (isomerizing)
LKKFRKNENLKLGKQFKLRLTKWWVHMQCCFLTKKPNEIVAARLGSPLQIGIGEGVFIARCFSFIEYTSNAVYLEDGEMANIRLHKDEVRKKLKMTLVNPYIQELQMNLDKLKRWL